MKAKIVLIHFPFTDLTNSKLRPALVLFESEHDVVVAFISSKVPVYLQGCHTLIQFYYWQPDFQSGVSKKTCILLQSEKGGCGSRPQPLCFYNIHYQPGYLQFRQIPDDLFINSKKIPSPCG